MLVSASFVGVVLAVCCAPPLSVDGGDVEEAVEQHRDPDAELIGSARFGAAYHVVALLKEGADPKAADRYGRTALHYAAGGGHVEIMQLLISWGADVNSKGNHGRTPLSEAAGSDRAEAVAVLLEAGAAVHPEALGVACWRNDTEAIDLLLDAGANPDDGTIPAAERGHVMLLRRLAGEGGNVNARSDYGGTPLHAAAGQGHVAVVKLLLASGADLTAKDNRGQTPLHRSVMGDADQEAIQLLVEAGAAIDIANDEGISPIRLAAMRGHRKAYESLLAANGGVERRSNVDKVSPEDQNAKTTAKLIHQLQSSDYATRKAAQMALLTRRKDVIPQVLQAVEEGADIGEFCPLLIRIGTEAQVALPKLKSLLADKKSVFGAALTMERIKPGAFHDLPDESREIAAASLYEAVIGQEIGVRSAFHRDYLAAMGEVATPYILKLLRSTNPKQRAAAAGSVKFRINYDVTIDRELLSILCADKAFRARISAARALGKGQQLSDEARAALLATVKLRPPYIRILNEGDATDGVPNHGDVITPNEVNGEEIRLDQEAAEALRRFRHQQTELADAAAGSLSKAGPDIIDDLIPLLSPVDAPARPAALITLRSIGPAAIPRIVELLAHEDDVVAISAIVALRDMGRPAVPKLVEALRSENQRVRHSAVYALQRMGRGAKSALPALLEVVASQRHSDVFRLSAVRAVLKIDAVEARRSPVILSSVPLLMRIVEEGQFEHQGWAAEALGDIGPAAAEALPVLRKRLEPPGDNVDTRPFGPLYVKRIAERAIPRIETVLPVFPMPE